MLMNVLLLTVAEAMLMKTLFSSWLPVAMLTSGSRTAGVTGGIATATQTQNVSGAKQLFRPGARDLEKDGQTESLVVKRRLKSRQN